MAQRLVLRAEPGGSRGGAPGSLPHPHRLAEGGGRHLSRQSFRQMRIGCAFRQPLSDLAACVLFLRLHGTHI